MSSRFYQVKNKTLFENFCKDFEQQGYHWVSGHALTDSKIVDKFNDFPFPLIFDVNEDKKEVQYESNMKYAVYAEEYSSTKQTKETTSIYIKTSDGKEYSYDLSDYYKNPNLFYDFMKKIRTPQIGDVVKITNVGQIYSTYPSWFKVNQVDVDIAARYAFGDKQEPEEGQYRVVAVGPHADPFEGTVYAIEKVQTKAYLVGKVYLINQVGIERF